MVNKYNLMYSNNNNDDNNNNNDIGTAQNPLHLMNIQENTQMVYVVWRTNQLWDLVFTYHDLFHHGLVSK